MLLFMNWWSLIFKHICPIIHSFLINPGTSILLYHSSINLINFHKLQPQKSDDVCWCSMLQTEKGANNLYMLPFQIGMHSICLAMLIPSLRMYLPCFVVWHSWGINFVKYCLFAITFFLNTLVYIYLYIYIRYLNYFCPKQCNMWLAIPMESYHAMCFLAFTNFVRTYCRNMAFPVATLSVYLVHGSNAIIIFIVITPFSKQMQ